MTKFNASKEIMMVKIGAAEHVHFKNILFKGIYPCKIYKIQKPVQFCTGFTFCTFSGNVKYQNTAESCKFEVGFILNYR